MSDPQTWPVRAESGSPDQTRALAGLVAGACRAGDVVLLVGDLGAGKTVFAQGFAAALGVAGPVTSPTFALVRHYRCGPDSPVAQLIHADVYRTGSLDEVADLALAELVEEDAVAVVEWGDLAAPALGESALEVVIEAPDAVRTPERRTVAITGRGRWASRADDVGALLAALGAPAIDGGAR
ncbi:MAG TPA: tRNA (adenosine(37)-N6)-threonylcarbamoyltransferase complex ATPase subunit type 1 TsaE [Acidimicrobiales bacterium]|nr:tRNA (adenosine(37)-N6)-threonylcarbamoyltransferase complex ATPase subunit type 1 TsaE [Acidimicrobiales bacterium]